MAMCTVCNEAVTQPICGDCLQTEIRTWIGERFPKRPELLTKLSNLTEEILTLGHDVDCVLCGKGMDVCSYCYTEHIFTWVRQALPKYVEEYLTFFSYDAEHMGYERQAGIS